MGRIGVLGSFFEVNGDQVLALVDVETCRMPKGDCFRCDHEAEPRRYGQMSRILFRGLHQKVVGQRCCLGVVHLILVWFNILRVIILQLLLPDCVHKLVELTDLLIYSSRQYWVIALRPL